jgi:dimethylargininase
MLPEEKFAIVREVPETYAECIRPPGSADSISADSIDVDLADTQHGAYCDVLRGLGLELIRLDADERYPDCCFVEDTAIIAGGLAIIAKIGAESRVGEEAAVRERLKEHMEVHELEDPARIDGGDVLVIGDKVYIGPGGRTNTDAVGQVRDILEPVGCEVIPVPVAGVLHLKSACTYLGEGRVLMLSGFPERALFDEYSTVEVPEEEAYAANCLPVRRRVLVSAGYPRTRDLIEAAGFETIELEMSEFRKGQGSLTCLSKIF